MTNYTVKDKTGFIMFTGTLEQCRAWLGLWTKRQVRMNGYIIDIA